MRKYVGKYSSGRYGLSISDRSGQQFPHNEMVKEPGTGLWVHRSESDGKWNRVDHPRNFIKMPPAEPQHLKNARPQVSMDSSHAHIQFENGAVFLNEDGLPNDPDL
jgi:hypothetical protein